jgi:hypothetical protein
MARKVKTFSVPKVWADKQWTVRFGRLGAGRDRLEGAPRLFKVVGEKLPFEAINAVNGSYGARESEEPVGIIGDDRYIEMELIGRVESSPNMVFQTPRS